MTIVATINNGSFIQSLCDSMISRPGADNRLTTVLSVAPKFLVFRTIIKTPSIRMGRIDNIVSVMGPEIIVAFAGNYSNVSSIATEFGTVLTSQLNSYFDHVSGENKICVHRNMNAVMRGAPAEESEEQMRAIPARITMEMILDIFCGIVEKHCSNYASHVQLPPDVEFQLFSRLDNSAECVEVICRSLQPSDPTKPFTGPIVNLKSRKIGPFQMSVLGSPSLKKELENRFGRRLAAMEGRIQSIGFSMEPSIYESEQSSKLRMSVGDEYNDLASEMLLYIKEIIFQNKNGIGGEMKALMMEALRPTKILYFNPD